MAGASGSAAMPSSASRAAGSNSGCSPLPPSAATPSPSRPRRLRRPPRRPRRRRRRSASPPDSPGVSGPPAPFPASCPSPAWLRSFSPGCGAKSASCSGANAPLSRSAWAAAPPASPLAALAAIGALVLSLILVGFALGLPVRLRRGRDALLGLGHVVRLEVVFVLLIVDRGGNGGRRLQRQRLCLLQAVDLLALLDDEGYLAFDRGIGIDRDDDAEALFEHAQMSALVVEEVERDLGARAHREIVRCALEQHLIERTQELQRDRRHRTHMAGAAAMRAFLGRALQHARADALAGHFEQPEMRDVPDLDACAVVPQAFLQPALDRAIVALLVHIDEIDDDQAGEIAQAQLPGHLLGGLEVGLERGVLDVMLAG